MTSSSFTIVFGTDERIFTENADQKVTLLISQLAKDFQLDPTTIKLISKGKNVLQSIDINATSVSEMLNSFGRKLLLIGSKLSEKKRIENSKADSLVMGFDEEMRRVQKAKIASQTLQLNPYISQYDALDIYPNPEAAISLLKRVAADPGIVAIMKKRNWTVGVLNELKVEGQVGISEVCLLGLNTNKGQAISLRLRTDNLAGFRNFETIKEVMLHELVHNWHSDHNNDFWSLFRQLKREVVEENWQKRQGHRFAEEAANFPISPSSLRDEGHVLGGKNGHRNSYEEVDRNLISQKAAERASENAKRIQQEKLEKERQKQKEILTKPTPTPAPQPKPQPQQQTTTTAITTTTTTQPPLKKPKTEETNQNNNNNNNNSQIKNWTCTRCTFDSNTDSDNVCQICLSERDVDENTDSKTISTNEMMKEFGVESKDLQDMNSSVSSTLELIDQQLDALFRSTNNLQNVTIAFQTLERIVQNILKNPNDQKFQKLSISTNKYQTTFSIFPLDVVNSIFGSMQFEKDENQTEWKMKNNFDLGRLWLFRDILQKRIAFLEK